MTRQEWTELAKALATYRRKIIESWPPKGGYMSNAPGVGDRKLYRAAQLTAVDELTVIIADKLKGRSTRFDKERFLALVGIGQET
jgi:hypothetical protein